MGMVHVGHHDA